MAPLGFLIAAHTAPPIRRGMHCNQQPRIGRIPLALIAVSHAAAVPSALSLFHLATQAFTLRKPSARQDAWHFAWQVEPHPPAWLLAWLLARPLARQVAQYEEADHVQECSPRLDGCAPIYPAGM